MSVNARRSSYSDKCEISIVLAYIVVCTPRSKKHVLKNTNHGKIDELANLKISPRSGLIDTWLIGTHPEAENEQPVVATLESADPAFTMVIQGACYCANTRL